jgi:hypothetical protein
MQETSLNPTVFVFVISALARFDPGFDFELLAGVTKKCQFGVFGSPHNWVRLFCLHCLLLSTISIGVFRHLSSTGGNAQNVTGKFARNLLARIWTVVV